MSIGTLLLTEFLGTALLIILGNGIVSNVVLKGTKGNNAGWLSIAMGWGLAVFIAALISNALGGVAHLNPAVTIAIAISSDNWGFANLTEFSGVGAFFLVLLIQFIGAIVGQLVVDLVYYKHILITLNAKDEFATSNVLAMHATGPSTRSIAFNFIMEFVGTAVLVLAILSFGKFNGGIGLPSYFAPFLVGGVIITIGLSLGGTTGYAINPFRDLAPRLVHQLLPLKGKGTSDWQYGWIPVVAPALAGVVVGVFFLI